MTVFRFMSNEEFELFNKGETLINNKDHSKFNNTTSKGFCFIDCDDYKPEFAYMFLTGIVSEDICCKFEVDGNLLIKSKGIYADPYGSFFDTIKIYEYCCESYNKKDFKLVDFTHTIKEDDFEWASHCYR